MLTRAQFIELHEVDPGEDPAELARYNDLRDRMLARREEAKREAASGPRPEVPPSMVYDIKVRWHR